MKDIKNLNIWKPEETTNQRNEIFLHMDIMELNLSVRSFHCLKRAGCTTIEDVLKCMGEDGQGLQKIRNLGVRSETEILGKMEALKQACSDRTDKYSTKKVTIIKPAKKVWDREIDEFHLSNYALHKLQSCGIRKVGDLYATNPKNEPGWYAVRELFEKIPSSR